MGSSAEMKDTVDYQLQELFLKADGWGQAAVASLVAGGVGSAMSSSITREELEAHLKAANAESDTKTARLEGKLDTRFAQLDGKFDVIIAKMDGISEGQKSTKAGIWALAGLIIVGFGIMVAVIVALPGFVTLGGSIHDIVHQQIIDQEPAPHPAAKANTAG